ncbi:MAG: hypothetical protein IPN02_18815 [Candidatus Microthrix sp.]|uniref:Uncharacterized protein n=1 Tax=Candidatus Neomicrothrix subdominans TaxID=2954438 RepID=A0A936NG96_9ACTN|nr:hypothetical protein [Candidatus Microthrix subdominans]
MPVRLGLAAALGLTVLGGAPGSSSPGRARDPAWSLDRISRRLPDARNRRLPPPAPVDPTAAECRRSAGYHSSVLTVGTARWSLGDDACDGRLVGPDGDGWSQQNALRNDGGVFLVRHFPVNASDAVRVRSVATAPGPHGCCGFLRQRRAQSKRGRA